MRIKNILTAFIFLLIELTAYSQTFPVQVNTQLIPPYTPYLSDYTTPGSQKLMVQLRLNDPTVSSYTCKLRITIEGSNITIRSKSGSGVFYTPITIQGGGIPETFYGEDLEEYFRSSNLDFAGISRAQYEKGAKLPEGIYRFTVEVLDYNRNTVVSNKGTGMAWVILNDPPILNLPRTNAKMTVIDPNNIAFTWTPRHTGSPNAAFTTNYVFRLVEVWPLNRNPYDAFLSSPVLYEATTNFTQLVYGPAEPALIQGRKYAWQVQAIDEEGRDLFKNQGKSEVFVFQYGDALGSPEGLYLQSAGASSLTFRWEPPINAPAGPVKYKVRYRLHNNRKTETWYESVSDDPYSTLGQLQASTEYEVQVRAEQNSLFSEYAPQQIFKTNPLGTDEFACKVVTPPVAPNGVPVPKLNVGDMIHAGGYDVEVKKVTASGSLYTGEGLVIVPWFKLAKVRATFKNIGINNLYWLTAGEIKTVWDPDSKFLIKVPDKDVAHEVADATVGAVAVGKAETESLIEITGAAIATVTKNSDGDIVVSTTDGETKVLPKGTSYSIADKVGNGYIVDKEGNIAKTTAAIAEAAATRGNRTYNLAIRFDKGAGVFGFDEKHHDALAQYYQKLEDGSYIPWKAVTSTESDKVDAILEGSDFDPKKIKYEFDGAPITPTTSANPFTFDVKGLYEGSHSELIAMYPNKDDETKNDVVGKLNLVDYDKITRNVVVVPVNKTVVPDGVNTDSVTKTLNNIYGQAVAEWRVSFAIPITVGLGEKFDDGESGLLTNYTEDMKKVIKAYGNLQDNTYYLFLVDNPESGTTALGYMPRSKQAGFIFLENHKLKSKDPLLTIAHELGHGAFNLQHTFKEFTGLPEGKTLGNLMDYPSGNALYKYQWDHVHDPQRVIGLFEDDADGALKVKEGEIVGYVISDSKAYARQSSSPYTIKEPKEILTIGKEITLVKVLVEDKFISLKYVNETTEQITSIGNITKIIKLATQEKYLVLKNQDSFILPYSSTSASNVCKKDSYVMVDKVCGIYSQVKENTSTNEGWWIPAASLKRVGNDVANGFDWMTTITLSEPISTTVLNQITANRNGVNDKSDASIYGKNRLKTSGDGKFYIGYENGSPQITGSTEFEKSVKTEIYNENSKEGGFGAINTYDDEIFTWGKGFAVTGSLMDVFDELFKIKGKNYEQILLNVGIRIVDGSLWILDETGNWKKDVPTKKKDKYEASEYIKNNVQLLSFFSELAEKKDYQQDIINVQYKVFEEGAGDFPDYILNTDKTAYDENWSNASVTVLSHLSHWCGYSWSVGTNRYKDTNGDLDKILYKYIYNTVVNFDDTRAATLETNIYRWKAKFNIINRLEQFGNPKSVGFDELNEKWSTNVIEIEFKQDKNKKARAIQKDTKNYITNSECIIIPKEEKFIVITKNADAISYEILEE